MVYGTRLLCRFTNLYTNLLQTAARYIFVLLHRYTIPSSGCQYLFNTKEDFLFTLKTDILFNSAALVTQTRSIRASALSSRQ